MRLSSGSKRSELPNPRLQRTRMRVPLSRKPLGNGKALTRRLAIVAAVLILAVACWRVAPPRAASISVVVTDPAGSVIAGVKVTAHLAGVQGAHERVTDAQGRALFEGLKAGDWEVAAPFRTGPTLSARIALADGQMADAHLVLGASGTAGVGQ